MSKRLKKLFTSRSKSRDTIHVAGDSGDSGDSGDWVQHRNKQGKTERKTKSELFPRSKFNSREIPKFVLIVEDYSSVNTSEMLAEEDERAENPGAESEEKHDETVSNEAGKPAQNECEKNNHCSESG